MARQRGHGGDGRLDRQLLGRLSLSSLALLLLAVRTGYSLIAIGRLTAMSAVFQLLTRPVVNGLCAATPTALWSWWPRFS